VILLHVPDSWPRVLAREISAAQATLGDWYGISDSNLAQYADVLLPIFDNAVACAWDVTGWHRTSEDKIIFDGQPSAKWAHLIGTPNPGKPWGVRGMARPIQYLDTRIAAATVPVEDIDGIRRASIDGYTLTIDHTGAALLSVPAGRKVTVLTTAA
jgi:hypothetical protein